MLKTTEEIIAYLEAEMAEAYELYDLHKGKQTTEAFAQRIKANTIEQLLDGIKNG